MTSKLSRDKCVKVGKIAGETLDFVLERQNYFADFDKIVKELQMQIDTAENYTAKIDK